MPDNKLKNDRKISSNNTDLDKFIAQHDNKVKGKLWKGFKRPQHSLAKEQNICTGYKSVNNHLHNKGWPLRCSNEFGIKHAGIGELRLLLPALRKLQTNSQQKEIIFISPPYSLFAPALEQYGIEIESVTIINAQNLNERLWATEQSLLANCCAAVISWYGRFKISHHELRRLQLATEESCSWNVLFRDSKRLEEASAAGFRAYLSSTSYCKLQIDIIKQPNGWGGQRCVVSLAPHYENWQRIDTSLLPHNQNERPPLILDSNQADIKKRTSNLSQNLNKDTAKESENTVIQAKVWQCRVSIIGAISNIKDVR